MDEETKGRISKLLSHGLRHVPAALAITLDGAGFADVDRVLAGLAAKGFAIDADALEEIVATSDKQRFALSPDGLRIRANQGHSVHVDLGLAALEPPPVLFHGTVDRFLDAIKSEGLTRRSRTHVHLSLDEETARIVAARRRGTIVILRVRAEEMHATGYTFYRSANGVWLTDHVPPSFLDVTPTPEPARAPHP